MKLMHINDNVLLTSDVSQKQTLGKQTLDSNQNINTGNLIDRNEMTLYQLKKKLLKAGYL